jgi:DnaJ-class molecular chaperone
MTNWRTTECPNCRGYGVVSDYRGGDFNGAYECTECGGCGILWISPKDRVAEYPGGKFKGMWPGMYEKCEVR